MKKKLLDYKYTIIWMLIILSAPVAIGLLARWLDNPVFLGFVVIAAIIIYNCIKLIKWIDKKVGSTDF